MWEFWKNQFLTCIDKHAPMRSKRIGNKKSLWIPHELIQKMRKMNFLKKKAEQTKDQSCWDDFKTARNEVNSNSIKYAKRKYFSDNLAVSGKDPRKTWPLINEVSSRQYMKKVIADIEIGDLKISSAFEMAEAFNCHFANIGHDLARDIPSADTVPESYLISTNATFSFKSCSSNEVQKLLEKVGFWTLPSHFSIQKIYKVEPRVQGPEPRVQGPLQILTYAAKHKVDLMKRIPRGNDKLKRKSNTEKKCFVSQIPGSVTQIHVNSASFYFKASSSEGPSP